MEVEQRARWGVVAAFFVAGMVLASWVPYIPSVQQRLGLSDGDLGAVLASMATGALSAIFFVRPLIGRFGSRRITAVGGVAFSLILPAPVLAPSYAALAVVLFAFGFALATLDVAMNAQAVLVEARLEKPLMSGFHGLFSLGGLVGASFAGALLEAAVAPVVHLGVVVPSMALLCLWGASRLFPAAPGAGQQGPAFALPSGPLAALGALGFVMFVGEGALVDWTTVYLSKNLAASPGTASAGYAAFSGMMALGRFLGDRVTAALGPAWSGTLSALTAGAGLALALSFAAPVASVCGFGLSGLGFANLVPILFSAAGRTEPENPEHGIAGVAGVGYFGLVAGPAMIGFAAQALGLRTALALVAVSMALTALALGPAVRAAER